MKKNFQDMFFSSIIADSFRSSLDIYSKFIGWFFDFNNKESMGFSYKDLIKPLRYHSKGLSSKCNSLYISEAFLFLKTFRDAEKHEGIGKHKISLSNIEGTLKIELRRPEKISLIQFEKAACSCLQDFRELLRVTCVELQNWPLGFESPNDTVAETDDQGFFKMPSK